MAMFISGMDHVSSAVKAVVRLLDFHVVEKRNIHIKLYFYVSTTNVMIFITIFTIMTLYVLLDNYLYKYLFSCPTEFPLYFITFLKI